MPSPNGRGRVTRLGPGEKDRLMVEIEFKERKGNFVHDFAGTPPGVHCPRFAVITSAHGCQFDPRCHYCYLRGTFRTEPNPVVYTNTDKLLRDVERDWEKRNEPTLYNAGELADSFLDCVTAQRLVKLFGGQSTHKLLLLTKDPMAAHASLCARSLLSTHNGQTIVSFSVNALPVSRDFEPGAGDRCALTATVVAVLALYCYPIRLRIDPMIPISTWQTEYHVLADEFYGVDIERVTLGSLRYHPTVRQQSPDKRVFDYAMEWTAADRRYRVSLPVRVEMYRRMAEWLQDYLPGVPVGLCKETVDCFEALGIDPAAQHCNCVL